MLHHAMLRAALALALVLVSGSHAAADGRLAGGGPWITSWYAAPQAGWDGRFPLPMNVPAVLDNQSLRQVVRLSVGGPRIRLVFSNRYGLEPVMVADVHAGLDDQGAAVSAVMFAGRPVVSIPPGAVATSDPLALAVPALARLAVTYHLPARTPVTTFHWGAQQTIALAPGKVMAASGFSAGARAEGRLFLSAVMAETTPGGRTVVALGDSITDGNGSTPDRDRRWPDFLAQRLAPAGIAVANAGISGARLLKDGMGQSALARFEQDVLAQPGVSDVIVLLGINDIGWPGSPFAPAEPAVTFDALTAGYRQLLAAARIRGVRVTAATLPPFEDALAGTPYAGHFSDDKERLRMRLNAWIRTAGVFDAVVDFDAVLRDPAQPRRMRVEFDSGDHLHPGDAGYRAMAEAVDISQIVCAADRSKTRGRAQCAPQSNAPCKARP